MPARCSGARRCRRRSPIVSRMRPRVPPPFEIPDDLRPGAPPHANGQPGHRRRPTVPTVKLRSRLVAVPSLLCLAVSVGACGAARTPTATAAGDAQADSVLVQRVLADELALMHRDLPGAWVQNGTPTESLLSCRAATALRARSIGRARSPGFVLRGSLEVRVAAYVCATPPAARQGLALLRPLARCFAPWLAEALHERHYDEAAPSAPSVTQGNIGQGALAIQVSVPSTYRGGRFTWNLDETAVVQGRIVVVLDTLAGASTARFNEALAALLAAAAATAQR